MTFWLNHYAFMFSYLSMMKSGLLRRPRMLGRFEGSGLRQLQMRSMIRPISFLFWKIDSSASFFKSVILIYFADFFEPANEVICSD